MRVRIAVVLSSACREIQRSVLEGWLNLRGKDFEHFVQEVCGWAIDGSNIQVPLNKDNKAEGTVIRENVNFDRKLRVQLVCDWQRRRAERNARAEVPC